MARSIAADLAPRKILRERGGPGSDKDSHLEARGARQCHGRGIRKSFRLLLFHGSTCPLGRTGRSSKGCAFSCLGRFAPYINAVELIVDWRTDGRSLRSAHSSRLTVERRNGTFAKSSGAANRHSFQGDPVCHNGIGLALVRIQLCPRIIAQVDRRCRSPLVGKAKLVRVHKLRSDAERCELPPTTQFGSSRYASLVPALFGLTALAQLCFLELVGGQSRCRYRPDLEQPAPKKQRQNS